MYELKLTLEARGVKDIRRPTIVVQNEPLSHFLNNKSIIIAIFDNCFSLKFVNWGEIINIFNI